ncbi:hypothetical protein D9758_006040 [Tetrapyrgos nigripes]|uniref:RNA polymerase-associated protein LEO1 n=1 Tax=Tetrapyrgos nigripes TaxID=182062 RepID=A0A8H5G014_9AGAR|nr:hypothetical protein D9758_006040 [Tetrapyrgos nigripes]
MSSLAGALIPPENSYPHTQHHNTYEDNENDMKSDPEQPEEDEEMTDLFGNETAANEPALEDTSSARSDSEAADAEQRRALEYEEDENEIPPELAVEVREANVSFPNIPVPRSSDGDNWVIRMPNFVKVDSKPFHPDTYMGPEHDDEEGATSENVREKSMTIKLKVENTVRWRWTKDEYGNEARQSNGRIIRWSDGTLSLRLGKEFFDITQSRDTSASVPRQTLGSRQSQSQSQSQPQSQPQATAKSQGLTYLVAQHKRSGVLQAEAVVTGYMSLRPTSMQSETHRMLVRAVGQKHNKVARLRMAPDPTMDPEREKMELMKQSAKKTKRKNEDGYSGTKYRRQKRKSEGYFSDDMDGQTYAQSDEEDESGAKRKKNGEEKGDYQEDGFVVADESDEDDDFGVRRRAKKEEEDPLDRIDAKIERSQRKAGFDEDEEEEIMEVESEEEEDQKVRRPGASRRRAAVFEEDEED